MNGFTDIVNGFSQSAVDTLKTEADELYLGGGTPPGDWTEVTLTLAQLNAYDMTSLTEQTKFIIPNEVHTSQLTLQDNIFPIWVIAQNSMGVQMQSRIHIIGNEVIVDGFLFNGSNGNVYVNGNDAQINRCRWDDSDATIWLHVLSVPTDVPSEFTGRDCEVSYCEFLNKTNNADVGRAGQPLILRHYQEAEAPLNHHVHDCYWYNMPHGVDSNNYEAISTFTSRNPSTDTSDIPRVGMVHNTIIEDNLLDNCAGEAELIQGKASGMKVRNNTITNCRGSIYLRNCHECVVDSNIILAESRTSSIGIVIMGDDHVVTNNICYGFAKHGCEAMDGNCDNGGIFPVARNLTFDNNYVEVDAGAEFVWRNGRTLDPVADVDSTGTINNNQLVDPGTLTTGSGVLYWSSKDYNAEYTFSGNTYKGRLGESPSGGWTNDEGITRPDVSHQLTTADVGIDA